ncbi:unnamed protein product [Darwinula stevensoni]|uniref:CRAL-TRIO domain-containing protein n=1 Tax=Darwinula stevensoni TaxID=69355 RepID=A0A7R9FQ48_9CRUS|nr:unnamed protein product [Darwinula stevensoni]CAG0898827.1 unnamed protein product [Darwinula stevensoni]
MESRLLDLDLPPSLVMKAEIEIQEKPAWRDGDIQAFKDMIQKEDNLNACLDDRFIIRFLRARKYDYDRALRMLKTYYAMKAAYPTLFSQLQPSLLASALRQNIYHILPDKDDEGRHVFIIRMGLWDPNMNSMEEMFRAALTCLEYISTDTSTQVCGIVAITDCKGLAFHHAKHFTPSLAKRCAAVLKDCFPLRFKGIHVMNEPLIVDMLFSMLKPFLSAKILSRFHFHGEKLESLHQHVPKRILPLNYGGLKPPLPLDGSDLLQKLMDAEQWLNDLDNYGYRSKVPATKVLNSEKGNFFTGYFCLQGW